jgi:hypothetical protein
MRQQHQSQTVSEMPLFRNYKSDSIQTKQECSLDSPLQSLGFLFWYEIQDGGYGRT